MKVQLEDVVLTDVCAGRAISTRGLRRGGARSYDEGGNDVP